MGLSTSIPAYRSSRVFKIGTGDVFSAIFAHYWAEKKLNAVDASELASRSVSAYCDSGRLPVPDEELRNLKPIIYGSPGPVLIEGKIKTIGQRYTIEEAKFILRELGVDVFCPALETINNFTPKAVLILADGVDAKTVNHMCSNNAGIPVVVLQEDNLHSKTLLSGKKNVIMTSDFTTSLYFTAWAASGKVDRRP